MSKEENSSLLVSSRHTDQVKETYRGIEADTVNVQNTKEEDLKEIIATMNETKLGIKVGIANIQESENEYLKQNVATVNEISNDEDLKKILR